MEVKDGSGDRVFGVHHERQDILSLLSPVNVSSHEIGGILHVRSF